VPLHLTGKPRSKLAAAAAILTFAVPFASLYCALHDLTGGWDDGAITLAYARTLAHTGRFALTPASPIAEGTSSLLWTAIMALADLRLHTPHAMLIVSKVLAAASFLLLLWCVRKLAGLYLSPGMALLPPLLLALTVAPFAETFNGMEMNLNALLAVVLALTLLRLPNNRITLALACILACAMLLIRFESPLLVAFLLAGIHLQSPERRRSVVTIAVASALFFAAEELLRHHVFGIWIPNTVLAKRWFPYSGLRLADDLTLRRDALAELATVLAVPLAIILLQTLTHRHGPKLGLARLRTAGRNLVAHAPPLLALSVATVLQALLIGRNWGHLGRMPMPYLPFLLIALGCIIETLLQESRLQPTLLVALLVVAQAVLWATSLHAALGEGFPYRWCERSGLNAESIRAQLNLTTLSMLTPDVGATGLCCERLNVLDLGLLTSPDLARSGLAGVPALVRRLRPELIEAKQPWSLMSGLYNDNLLDPYALIEINHTLFYLRNDLLDPRTFTPIPCSTIDGETIWNAGPLDIPYAQKHSHCYRFSPPPIGSSPVP
jgi:hypothetical protein